MFRHALIVEDEENLGSALQASLQAMQISSTLCPTLAQAWKLIEQKKPQNEPDFILLDRRLPDGDGLTLCQTLRSQGYFGSILFLTASGEVDEKIQGLTAGADDYLAKPFSWEELSLRVQALARRSQTTSELYRSGPTLWSLDTNHVKIFGPKGWVTLTPTEFKLAEKLILASGKTLGREELLRSVWGFKFLPQTRTLDYFMGRLRKIFEENPDEPRHFLTIRGMGFRFDP